MESIIQAFKSRSSEKAYTILETITGYIDAHYATDTHFDGADELKFKCGGKTLVTLYLKEESIISLIIFGKREREQYEMVQASFSEFIRSYYGNSRTYHDGKWMYIELRDDSHLKDIIRLIEIKRKPNNTSISMCGYRCDLCKAYSRNIQKDDQRAALFHVWQKYYQLNIAPSSMHCDGCRALKQDAKCIDTNCPVRSCVLERAFNSCADCREYPCAIFAKREGLCFDQAREQLGNDFSEDEFDTFLRTFDNRTRLDRTR